MLVDSSSDIFQNYSHGIIDSDKCGTDTFHYVVIVGYGKDTEHTGLDYWLVRNEWGNDWGDNGYCKIARSYGDGYCAINHKPLYPTVAN